MSPPRLDGPRLPPAAGGAAKQLVVFLHGYGADGNDLIGLGREWGRMLPHAAFVSPHAPEACGMAPMGRQWFNLTFRDPGEMTRGVAQAGPVLDAFLAAELERLRLPSSAGAACLTPVTSSPAWRKVRLNHCRPIGAPAHGSGACGETKAACGNSRAHSRPNPIRSLPSAP